MLLRTQQAESQLPAGHVSRRDFSDLSFQVKTLQAQIASLAVSDSQPNHSSSSTYVGFTTTVPGLKPIDTLGDICQYATIEGLSDRTLRSALLAANQGPTMGAHQPIAAAQTNISMYVPYVNPIVARSTVPGLKPIDDLGDLWQYATQDCQTEL